VSTPFFDPDSAQRRATSLITATPSCSRRKILSSCADFFTTNLIDNITSIDTVSFTQNNDVSQS
jgi:hypothetical protein